MEPLKNRSNIEKRGTRYFTSDFHWYHTNILSYNPNRNCFSIEEMNNKIINNINDLVKENDELWVIGDLSMAIRPIEVLSSLIICKNLFLISGNHDWCSATHKKSNTPEKLKYWINFYESHGWSVQSDQVYLDATDDSGQVFLLCHLPYRDTDNKHDTYKKRYSDSYPEDTGTILLHGHTHSTEKISVSKRGTLQIHIGIDAWDMKPVSELQIIEIVELKSAT
jgi:calcineurin-like phosphoesterase family protein